MHQVVASSEAIRHIYYVIVFCLIAFCLQGIVVDYEAYGMLIGTDFDLFNVFYSFGIALGIFGLYGVWTKRRRVEKFTVAMTCTFFIMFFLLGAITAIYSPSVVLSFAMALLSGIVHSYLKKGRVNEVEFTPTT